MRNKKDDVVFVVIIRKNSPKISDFHGKDIYFDSHRQTLSVLGNLEYPHLGAQFSKTRSKLSFLAHELDIDNL